MSDLYPMEIECRSGMTSIFVKVTEEDKKMLEDLSIEDLSIIYKKARDIYRKFRLRDTLFGDVGYPSYMFINNWAKKYECLCLNGCVKEDSFIVYTKFADKLEDLNFF